MNNLINIELERQAEEIYTFESRGTVNQFIDIIHDQEVKQLNIYFHFKSEVIYMDAEMPLLKCKHRYGIQTTCQQSCHFAL